MLILDAYNRLLQAAGELKVSSIDSLHPIHSQVMSTLNDTTRASQIPGWWFNKYRTELEYPYVIPPNLSILGWRWNGTPVTIVGQQVYKHGTREPITDPRIRVEVVEAQQFAVLPDVFAEWVVCMAEYDLARTFDADGNKISLMAQAVNTSFTHVHAMNVRHASVNMLEIPSMQRKMHKSMQYPRRW